MPFAYVHVSDIHFGQDRGGSELYVYEDVKTRLVEDARIVMEAIGATAAGILVTGDIAYAGKRHEYVEAAKWLDGLALAIGCLQTDVVVVPGNHDIDRDGISTGGRMMIEAIVAEGEPRLSAFLKEAVDREVLYNRFAAYRPFAEGYDCPLATQGGFSSHKTKELAPGRRLRFIGLNSALVCSKDDAEGTLLLGTQQHVLPRADGEELVVLCHHPLNWLQDAERLKQYLRSRARLFISGHEHNPSLSIETVPDGSELMSLAAGATVPPIGDTAYTYTYNVLIFDWDAASDGLRVEIRPRAWSWETTAFEADDVRLGGRAPSSVLGCPNFCRAPKPDPVTPRQPESDIGSILVDSDPFPSQGTSMSEDPALTLLRFFRDLTPAERIALLVQLQALPSDWDEPLTHTVERTVFDGLIIDGRTAELNSAIEAFQAGRSEGEDTDHG